MSISGESCDSDGTLTRRSLSSITGSSGFTPSVISISSSECSLLYDSSQAYPIRYYFDVQQNQTVVDIGRSSFCELTHLREILQKDKSACRAKKFDIVIDQLGVDLNEVQKSLQILGELLHVQVPVVESLSLQIFDYRLVGIFGLLANHLPFLKELTIGSPSDETNVNFLEQIEPIGRLLATWLPLSKDTLRTLRIYPGIKLEENLVEIFCGCLNLKYLTLARVELETQPWKLPTIRYFGWDGLGMAYIDSDIFLMQRLFHHFPNVIEASFTRIPWEVLEALVTMCLEVKRETVLPRKAPKRKSDSAMPIHPPLTSRFGSIGKGLRLLGEAANKILSPRTKKKEDSDSTDSYSTIPEKITMPLYIYIDQWSLDEVVKRIEVQAPAKELKISNKHFVNAKQENLSCMMVESKRHETTIWLRAADVSCDACKKKIALLQGCQVE